MVQFTVSTYEEDAELLLQILKNIKIIREIKEAEINEPRSIKYHYDIAQTDFEIG